MPIYRVQTTVNSSSEVSTQDRLIEAKNEAGALKYAVMKHIGIDRASPGDLIELTKAGVEVEVAA